MEDKNRNRPAPHQPEQQSFEEYTSPQPNEIRPQEYDTDPETLNDTLSRNQATHRDNAGQGTGQQHTGHSQNDEVDLTPEMQDESAIPQEDEDETKSPLRPIDKNKAPEDWQQNRRPGDPEIVEDSKDTPAQLW